MTKWYEETDQLHDVFVMKRLRLVRNIADCIFPSRLSKEDREEMLQDMEAALLPVTGADGNVFDYMRLDLLSEDEKKALYEHRVINYSRVEDDGPVGLAISADETMSIVFGGDDHLRLQLVSGSQGLEQMWKQLSKVDDLLGEKVPYAFDPKYGYLTPFLTNVGTGLRASVICHLPMLSTGNQFRKLVQEYGRFGISIKGLDGEGTENFGGLYEVKNQKTLGRTEEQLVSLVAKAAGQLASHERKVKALAMRAHRLQIEDEVYKSYGVLKYARKLTYKEGMKYLSQLRLGLCEGLIQVQEPVNVFGIMLNIRPANLKAIAGQTLEGEELDQARALYIREHLPEIC